MSAPKLHAIHGQPSWSFRSSHVHVNLTQLGGHLGPVKFRVGRKIIAPFSVAPWAGEKLAPGTPDIIRVLRGDFFCAPFGGNATPWRGEQHPVHGESANGRWRLETREKADDRVTLHASLGQKIRRGRVDKYVMLIKGHSAVYQRHVLSGSSGPMNVGHHAMLKFPEAPGSGIISTSAFLRAQVFPGAFENPDQRGYQSLKPAASFRSLSRVPLLNGGTTDLSRYPGRKGFEDLVMLTADPKLPFAWTAVTFPKERHVWFALRDPRQLRHTILWISNGGRHYPPWSSRHTAVMGLEEVTAYFHCGLAESVKPNPLNRKGIPTALALHPKRPTMISYIMGVAAIPAGFDRVARIQAARNGVELISSSGRRVSCSIDLAWLK
ncbi:MAG: hypothetical protein EXS43_06190 [Opitutus sp.]|nr:hypothetical protein [Opitutus sp.]